MLPDISDGVKSPTEKFHLIDTFQHQKLSIADA